jgi:hypothetical protein
LVVSRFKLNGSCGLNYLWIFSIKKTTQQAKESKMIFIVFLSNHFGVTTAGSRGGITQIIKAFNQARILAEMKKLLIKR